MTHRVHINLAVPPTFLVIFDRWSLWDSGLGDAENFYGTLEKEK